MRSFVRAASVLVCLVVTVTACSSTSTLFVEPPQVASEYRGKVLAGGTLAVVVLQESLHIGGDRGGVRVSGAYDFYSFFVQSLADSIRVRGGFDSVDVFGADAISTKERTLRVNSTTSEVFVTPDAVQAVELEGETPDFLLVINSLDVDAVGRRLNGTGLNGMGTGPPTAHGSARYVVWDNRASRLISWGNFSHYVVPEVEFRDPRAWHQLTAHMADLMFRKTPFSRG